MNLTKTKFTNAMIRFSPTYLREQRWETENNNTSVLFLFTIRFTIISALRSV